VIIRNRVRAFSQAAEKRGPKLLDS